MYFQIPKICISPAPPEEPTVEPYSPFSFIPQLVVDHDAFRPVLLSPPPSVNHFSFHSHSQNPSDGSRGIGLESQRFQQLLKAARERKASNLHKELAVKIHKNRQVERRALFLSKLQVTSSPTDTMSPTTPPDSPTVFQYSISSPGFMSLFTALESDKNESCEGWIDQGYFDKQGTDTNLTNKNNSLSSSRNKRSRPSLPSLEQISARMIPPTINPSDYDVDSTSAINITSSRTRPLIGVGRLRMPVRASQQQPRGTLAPPSSQLKVPMIAVVETTPASMSSNPETNSNAFNIRGQRAHDMLCTLRRRTAPILAKSFYCDTDEDNKSKRHSAPAEMISHPRIGFVHPILALPGSF